MPSILFVCTVNRFRSPLAEAVFRQELKKAGYPGDWTISSAGTWTEAGIPPMTDAIFAAAEVGLDISSHRSRPISADLVIDNTLIIVMHSNHKEALNVEFPEFHNKIFLLTEAIADTAHDIPDPFVTGEPPLQIARELIDLIQTGWVRICQLAEKMESEGI
jgi:protein-tyrosine-phosphatase